MTANAEEDCYFGSLDDFHTLHDAKKLKQLRETVDAMTPRELKRYEDYRRSSFNLGCIEKVVAVQ